MRTIILFFGILIPTLISSQENFTKQLIVNATILNLRNSPHLEGEIVEKLKYGEVVQFEEVSSKEGIKIKGNYGFWLKV